MTEFMVNELVVCVGVIEALCAPLPEQETAPAGSRVQAVTAGTGGS